MDSFQVLDCGQFPSRFLGFVPAGVVPDDHGVLVGVFKSQIDQGVGDGAGVLPVQPHEVDRPVVLVAEPDAVLGLPFPVDRDPGLGVPRVPGPAHDGLVLDPYLVGGHDQRIIA